MTGWLKGEWCGAMGVVVGERVWGVGERCLVDFSLFTTMKELIDVEKKKRKKAKKGLMVEYFLSDVKFILAGKHKREGRRGSPICSVFAPYIPSPNNNNNNNNNDNDSLPNVVTFELPRQDTSSFFFLALSTHRVLVFSTTHFRTLFEIQLDSIPVSLHVFGGRVWILTEFGELVSFCMSSFKAKKYDLGEGVLGEGGKKRDDFICGSEVVDGRLWVGLYFFFSLSVFHFLILFFFHSHGQWNHCDNRMENWR